MKKMYFFSLSMLLLMLLSGKSRAQCLFQTQTFTTNPTLAATNTNGAWYPDRYAPSGFTADAGRLKISINPADGAQNRPAAFSSSFYNTQGRKFNQCGTCVTTLKGDLYIPADWATKKRRSDMWATALNNSNVISGYPIIGFRNVDGSTPGIYYYDFNGPGAWVNSGVALSYDSWYSLEFRISGSNLEYLVNNTVVGTVSSNSSAYFGEIIMQAYNFNDNTLGVSYDPTADNAYDAFWDNIVMTVPGVTNTNTGELFCTIQSAIDDADTQAGHTIAVADGTYNEAVNITKSVTIQGASRVGTIIKAPCSGTNFTVNFAAQNITLKNLTVTRNFNSLAEWYACTNNNGILIASAATGAVVDNVLVTGNRNGIAIETPNTTIRNSIIEANRTGIHMYTNITGSTLRNNFIRNNFTHGVLFNFDNGGSLISDNVSINNNSITGNWYSQVNFQSTNAYPIGSMTGLSFTCNWYGVTNPTTDATPAGELGYGSLPPSQYGGTDPTPTGAEFRGTQAALIPYAPSLANGTDSDLVTDGFQPAPGSCSVCPGGGLVTNTNTTITYCSIQAAINDPLTLAGHTITVAAGTYNEDVVVNKALTINGAGIDVSTVVGPIGGGGSTFQIGTAGVVINGFTITRAGNNTTDWNNPNLNTAGISIQGQGITAEIKNNKITGNRTGIDVNNSNGNNIHNNIITFNRTGLIFRNQTDNTTLVQNEITDNWTVGIVFLDASGGTNSPVQTAVSSSFNNNKITGNWYGGIVDRQTGGSLPAPGTNFKNFTCNWYGSTTPVTTTANSAEPGYAAQIPVAYGGSAANPGGAPDIAGPASANITFLPFLTDGTDSDGSAIGFQPVPGSCNGCLTGGLVTNTNTGELFCSIQAAIDDPQTLAGHTITVAAGTYNESVNINKSLTLQGAQANICATTVRVGAETIINCTNGIGINASNVSLNGFTIQGQTSVNSAPGFGYAIYMAPTFTGTQLLNNIIKNNVVGSSLANTGATQVQIKCNWFDSNNNSGPASGVGIYTDEYVGGGVVSNVLIDNNKFTGHINDGGIDISVSTSANAATGITVTNNTFTGNRRAAFLYNTVSSSFTNNVISGSTGSGTGELRIFGGVNSLSVMNNSFSAGTPQGIRITDDGAGAVSANITVSQNSFTGYSAANFAIANVSGYTGSLSATCNWFGVTGPAVAALVSGNVSYDPSLSSGTDNDPAIGFQPVPGSCSGCSATATISPTTAICTGTGTTIVFTGTPNATVTYNINSGSNTTIVLDGMGSASLPTGNLTATTTYSLVSVNNGSCTAPISGDAVITVVDLPNAPANVSTFQCAAVNATTLSYNSAAELTAAAFGTDPCPAGSTVQWVTGVGSTTLLTFPTTPIALGNAGTFYARCQTTTAGCWSTNTATVSITFRPTPQSALTASKVDVCPNELVTLDAHCTIPTATVNWNPGAPTVTPNAAPTPYIYKASCTADGCTGNESSVEVRTHRILVDMKDLGSGPLPKAVIGSVQDNMAPTNTITAPSMPRRWTFIATGCAASESAVFKLSGPVNFNTIDNAATYAMFANEGSNFYSIDHPNYGNGGSFPNGTYTLTIDLRSQDGVGGPFPKNRMPTGALLATRTLQFTVANSLNRIGTAEEPIAAALKDENWMNIGQNPVSDKIQVHLFGKANEEVHLSLMNLQGQTVRLKSIKMEASQQIEVLDVTDAPSGLYILKGAKADQVKTIKVIKID